MTGHIPVLMREAIAALSPKPGEVYVDATFGGGGYTRAILEAADCRVIAIDRDPDAIARANHMAAEYCCGVIPAEGPFGKIERLVAHAGADEVHGVVFDFGVSSFQIDEADRGFSFRFDAPLDMRMSQSGPSAADAVAKLSEAQLADIIYLYGEEHRSRRIARAIVQHRAIEPIKSTGQLAEIVRAAAPDPGSKIHPATKTFQALRIFVNNELGEIASGLQGAERVLAPGGRLVAVSFHSLEDRIVKSFLGERTHQSGGGGSRFAPEIAPRRSASFEMDRRGVIAPGEAELQENPRARSAKLRFAVRTGTSPTDGIDLDPRLDALSRLGGW
jgi:16S rRNA (cytosine1402-N4)-methyltransferase